MASPAVRKKLIEVSIPLEAINKASAREKSIRHGHPSTLHLWWARRPLAACRAVLFAQLVDDPSSWPDRFKTEEEQDAERRRLHKVIEDLVPWEASNDEQILTKARYEIARSVAWGLGEEAPPKSDDVAILDYLQSKAPPVYDPFSGGGSIPLEAQRLGLRAYGSDVNPVAVLIGKALVEIPPKFAGLPPVNPEAQAELKNGGVWNGKGAQGLAEDVRYYGRWMRDEAERRIGHLYPNATLPDGSGATVIAWLWARTVRSPDPSTKGAMVPLVSSFMLSTREGKEAWIEPVIDADAQDGWRFAVCTGEITKEKQDKKKKGTKTGHGANFACLLSGTAIGGEYIKAEAKAGRMSARMMAVVAEGPRTRLYFQPDSRQESAAAVAQPELPEIAQEMLHDPRALTPVLYNLDRWDKLFTPRQLVGMTTFSDLIAEAREKVLDDAKSMGFAENSTPLHAGGGGSVGYADAVATYLAFVLDRVVDRHSTIATWDSSPSKLQLRNTFARHAVPMTWDFGEGNPLCSSSGTFGPSVDWVATVLKALPVTAGGAVYNCDAPKNSFPIRSIVVSTDPPYYDNIGYADLSDFFYVWLKRSLSGIWPDLFRRLTTPKDEELVATPYRHGSKSDAEAFFMKGMSGALSAMRTAATDSEPLAIYYAYKQAEIAKDGIFSAGWTSFLQATVDAGLAIDGTWPVRTELANRMRSQASNALASSIVLVCRKRATAASIVTRADFIRSLKRELPEAIDKIRKAGVGPVDMQQSVIGPGMGIFTRHAKVLEDDDSVMTVRTALGLINRVWEEIENELDTVFDAETQVALAWFATYGLDARPSGELITLANAKNVSLNDLFKSEVFRDLRGKAALTPREELPAGWTPLSDRTLTVWECVQHTARVLAAEDGGAQAAACLIVQMGAKAADARALAYRLYEIASQKGWAQEALVYNELAQDWANLEDIAASIDRPDWRTAAEAAQGALDFAGGQA